MEIGEMLRDVFPLLREFQFTFNVPLIRDHWTAIQRKLKCPSLPEAIQKMERTQFDCEEQMVRTVIQRLINGTTSLGISANTLRYQVILRGIQRYINPDPDRERDPTTRALTFDADHAVASRNTDIFVTNDDPFALSLRELARVFNGMFEPIVVTNLKEFRAAIKQKQKAGKM